ncbi:MAG: ROK family protein [Candidatus Woesearchaeota archaeon]
MKVLALDIGGTNTRISFIEIKNKKPVITKLLKKFTNEINDLAAFINDFNKNTCKECCVGFAGPVIGKKLRLTNANLEIDVDDLKRRTNLNIIFINDFHAVGLGVKYLNEKEFLILNKGKGFNNNVEMVVGPGTGLGKSYIINNKVYPCEGGLTTLGIEDIQDYALLDYLKDKQDLKNNSPVYYEDVISGDGLIDIYDHLEIKTNMKLNLKLRSLIKEEPVNKAKIISKYSSKDKLCDMTLHIFTKFYARFVRDSALNLISSKVYLVGGISEAISNYLEKYFMKEFLRHRKYSSLLKKINVSVVLNQDVGILGAGALAANLVNK